jgi:gamma-glutamylputrescine oxidase
VSEAIFAPDFRAEPFWWEAARPFESQAELPERTDVVIVGSGFCGLSAGNTCVAAGHSTVVLDAGPIGGMASSRSGAMISSAQKILLSGNFHKLWKEQAEEAIRLHREAFDYVKSLAVEGGLEFDFQQCGRLFLAAVPRDLDRFRGHAALLRTKGNVTTHILAKEELRSEIGSDHYYGGMIVEEFGGIHPSKLGKALAQRFRRSGGLLASHTRVRRVVRQNADFRIETDRGYIVARKVLFATNGYTDQAFPYLKRRLAPAGSHIIATEKLPRSLMSEVMPKKRMYSDSKRSLWYFRPSPDGDRILFGARPCALPMEAEQAAAMLHEYLLRVFPQLKNAKLTHCWTGSGAMTSNRLQQIGSLNGVYYAVGCKGSGVAIMPYLGKLAAERMLGIRTSLTLFETSRFGRFPPYDNYPWFVSIAVAGYEMMDWADRKWAGV